MLLYLSDQAGVEVVKGLMALYGAQGTNPFSITGAWKLAKAAFDAGGHAKSAKELEQAVEALQKKM